MSQVALRPKVRMMWQVHRHRTIAKSLISCLPKCFFQRTLSSLRASELPYVSTNPVAQESRRA